MADTEARDIVIEAGTVHAVFTNRGAALKSWRLNHYKDQAGKPVDLVPQTLPDAPRPFQIETGNSAVDARANAALFRAAGGGATRDVAKGMHQVAFEYREAGGLSVRKLFTIDPSSYTIRAAIDAAVGGSTGLADDDHPQYAKDGYPARPLPHQHPLSDVPDFNLWEMMLWRRVFGG